MARFHLIQPRSRITPLANRALKTSAVITVEVIRSVYTMLLIVLGRFIFLASHHQANMAQFQFTFSSDMLVVFVVQ